MCILSSFFLILRMMNFPAFTVPTLRIGSTFDCNTAREGSDIFPPNIPTETEHVNAFSFRYKIVKTNEDVKELLNLPYDLSLRIKANLQNVEGLGKYINDLKIADGKTEVLAVMKCTTVSFCFTDCNDKQPHSLY